MELLPGGAFAPIAVELGVVMADYCSDKLSESQRTVFGGNRW